MSRADGLTSKKKRLGGRGIIIILLFVLAGISVSAATVYLYVNSKFDKIKPVEYSTATGEIIEFTETELSCVDVDGFVNILLIGVDSRDMNKLEGWRADAIIIASIKEETGEVYLTSVYRDTFLPIGESFAYDKVTHSFYYGGMKDTIKTLNQSMDLDIQNYIVFNFKAVVDVVDKLGGLDIDIEEYEINELNRINANTCKIIGQTEVNTVKEPGLQHLDGAQAVTYGRIRHGVGDDFKRTERMRIVIAKVMEKVKTLSFSEIDGLIEIGISHIKTNLSNSDIIGLCMRVPKFKIAGSEGFPYTVTTGMLNGISYVFPYNLYGDVAKLHEDFFAQKDYVPSDRVLAFSDTILGYYAGTVNQYEVDVAQYYENPSEQPQLLDWTEEENSTEGREVEEETEDITEEDPENEETKEDEDKDNPKEGEDTEGENLGDETTEEEGQEGESDDPSKEGDKGEETGENETEGESTGDVEGEGSEGEENGESGIEETDTEGSQGNEEGESTEGEGTNESTEEGEDLSGSEEQNQADEALPDQSEEGMWEESPVNEENPASDDNAAGSEGDN